MVNQPKLRTLSSQDLTKSAIWKQLTLHAKSMSNMTLTKLFEADAERARNFSLQNDHLFVDYSKNLIDDSTLKLLYCLAEEQALETKIHSLLSQNFVNPSDRTVVRHTSLRGVPILSERNKIDCNEFATSMDKMSSLVNKIREQRWFSSTRQKVTDIVYIGIGGSHLGPKCVTYALKPYWQTDIRCYFVANLDATHLVDILSQLKPQNTLFVIASKSFETLETIENAKLALKWLNSHSATIQSISEHLIAITENEALATELGIKEDNILPVLSGVCGRFSVWSCMGFAVALKVGMKHFEAFLAGGHNLDKHFAETEFSQNIPVTLALLDVWYTNFFHTNTHAILPYSHLLRYLPEHLQQLEMESVGKSITLDGKKTSYATGSVIWGGAESNGQHAFHQLLHQGTHLLPIDFIVPVKAHHSEDNIQKQIYANCLAQSQSLMDGYSAEQKEHCYKNSAGNHPSTTIVLDQITPQAVGTLLALYEHKIFVKSVIWNINAFDQWGVDIGKEQAKIAMSELRKMQNTQAGYQSSKHLIEHFVKKKK